MNLNNKFKNVKNFKQFYANRWQLTYGDRTIIDLIAYSAILFLYFDQWN